MKKLYFLILLAVCAFTSYAQRAPKAVNDVATIYENGSVVINVLANDSNFNAADTVCLTNVWGINTSWATVQTCTKVLYHPLNPTFVGLDTFYYRACDQQQPTLCDTGRVIVTVKIRAPKPISDTVTLINGDTARMNVLVNDTNYNPSDSIRVTGVWGAPAGWVTVFDSTQLVVHSGNPNYNGLLYVYYRACDTRVIGLCDTGIAVVNIIRTPKAYLDTNTLIQPDTSLIFVTVNDSDFNALDSACVTGVWGVPAGWAYASGCGQVTYHPTDFNHFGNDTFYYRSCYSQTPTLCDTGMIVVQVILPKPYVDFTWNEDSPCVARVFNNSTLTDSVKWDIQFLTGNGTNQVLYNVNSFPLAASTDSDFQAQVCLTAFNPSGDTTVCYSFWIQCSIGTSAIAEIERTHLRVYPNPAADKIQIDLSGIDRSVLIDASAIVIYDMIGKELKSIPVTEINSAISISELSSGMYMIGLLDKAQNRKMLSKFEVVR